MCGIFGVINGDPNKFKILGLLNESRGTDSWGFYDFDKVTKDIGSFRVAVVKHDDRLHKRSMLGHTRAATHGTVSYRNAHPFEYENIIGAHNGVILNWNGIRSNLLIDPQGEDVSFLNSMQVDSEILFYLIAKNRMNEFSNLTGYAAIWWVDKNKPGSLFLYAANHAFYYKSNPRGKLGSFYFSSQDDHLRSVGVMDAERADDETILRVDTITGEVEKIGTQKFGTAATFRTTAWSDDEYDLAYGRYGASQPYRYQKALPPTSAFKQGLHRSDYFDRAYDRYSKYKEKVEERENRDRPTPSSWSANIKPTSKKQRKRLIKAVDNIRRNIKLNKMKSISLCHIDELCGVPVKTGTCRKCGIEWPWTVVKSFDKKAKNVGECPSCQTPIPGMEALWCPRCDQVVTYGTAVIDSGESGPVMGCPDCNGFLEDLFLAYQPVMADVRWAPFESAEKKEEDKGGEQ